jgi:hypothetical protein
VWELEIEWVEGMEKMSTQWEFQHVHRPSESFDVQVLALQVWNKLILRDDQMQKLHSIFDVFCSDSGSSACYRLVSLK